METRLVFLGLVCLTLSGCAFYRPSAGNPNGDSYVGSAKSTYEASANPQHTIGQVSYNPSAPLPETVPAPVANGSGMMPPPPPPARPAR